MTDLKVYYRTILKKNKQKNKQTNKKTNQLTLNNLSYSTLK
jgi:hypothetical protein